MIIVDWSLAWNLWHKFKEQQPAAVWQRYAVNGVQKYRVFDDAIHCVGRQRVPVSTDHCCRRCLASKHRPVKEKKKEEYNDNNDNQDFPGAEIYWHNSLVCSWAKLPYKDPVVIGGYESSVNSLLPLSVLGACALHRARSEERACSRFLAKTATFTASLCGTSGESRTQQQQIRRDGQVEHRWGGGVWDDVIDAQLNPPRGRFPFRRGRSVMT